MLKHSRRTVRGLSGNTLAFTLVELLVVLGIIAILAVLLSPVLHSVREGARKTQCVANMRVLYSGFSLYAADNSHSMACDMGDPTLKDWHRNIWPYINISGTWSNWTDAYDQANHGGAQRWPYSCPSMISTTRYVSYALNQNLAGKKFQSRSSVLLLAETQGAPANLEPAKLLTGSTANMSAGRVGTRHSDTANLVFEDGHLESRRLQDIPDTTSNPAFWAF